MSEPRISGEELRDIAHGYLAALDRLDLDGMLAFFAPDATFLVQSARAVVEGRDAIREMWASLFAAHESMVHRVTNIVVDDHAGKVATEQAFTGRRVDGEIELRCSCYFFDVSAARKLTRVIVWIDGETPAGA
jgi:uncharacterized protein (TIGR02246 family)